MRSQLFRNFTYAAITIALMSSSSPIEAHLMKHQPWKHHSDPHSISSDKLTPTTQLQSAGPLPPMTTRAAARLQSEIEVGMKRLLERMENFEERLEEIQLLQLSQKMLQDDASNQPVDEDEVYAVAGIDAIDDAQTAKAKQSAAKHHDRDHDRDHGDHDHDHDPDHNRNHDPDHNRDHDHDDHDRRDHQPDHQPGVQPGHGGEDGPHSKYELIVAAHHTANDCWVIVNQNVYDASVFVPSHPGKPEKLIKHCGSDITRAYAKVQAHPPSPAAYLRLVGAANDAQPWVATAAAALGVGVGVGIAPVVVAAVNPISGFVPTATGPVLVTRPMLVASGTTMVPAPCPAGQTSGCTAPATVKNAAMGGKIEKVQAMAITVASAVLGFGLGFVGLGM